MAEHNQRFETFEQWCNKASHWLTRHPQFDGKDFRTICFDSKGRICRIGGDFMRAEREGAFPVYWVWPDQNLFEAVNTARNPPASIRYAVLITGREARSGVKGNPIITHENEKFWPTLDNDGWVEASSSRAGMFAEGNLPADLKTFISREKAEEFGNRWKGHPWWCVPKSFEVVEVMQGSMPHGWERVKSTENPP